MHAQDRSKWRQLVETAMLTDGRATVGYSMMMMMMNDDDDDRLVSLSEAFTAELQHKM